MVLKNEMEKKMSVNVENKKTFDMKSLREKIKYEKLYGRGGSFLVTPLDKGKIFSKEMFSRENGMV